MKNPTEIKKKSTKQKESTFFIISYNGKELGKIGIFNIMTNAGTQGVRIDWRTPNEPYNSKKKYVFEYVDKDLQGNIKHTK